MSETENTTENTTVKKRAGRSGTSKNYINNADLLIELAKSHEQNRMTEKLGEMIILLCKRYITIPRFAKYTYSEDMQGFAILTVCRIWKGFDVTKGKNPFAYFTQCIHNAYFQYNNAERKQRDIKDEIRINNGMNSSYDYGDRWNENNGYSADDAYGDNDYMEAVHDRINPYAEDEVESEIPDFNAYDPTLPGEVITYSEEEIRILSLGE